MRQKIACHSPLQGTALFQVIDFFFHVHPPPPPLDVRIEMDRRKQGKKDRNTVCEHLKLKKSDKKLCCVIDQAGLEGLLLLLMPGAV